jgi:hypothetical protein
MLCNYQQIHRSCKERKQANNYRYTCFRDARDGLAADILAWISRLRSSKKFAAAEDDMKMDSQAIHLGKLHRYYSFPFSISTRENCDSDLLMLNHISPFRSLRPSDIPGDR